MLSKSGFLTFALAFGASVPTANAGYIGQLSFVQSTGVVSPTEEIPVWIRLTLDPSSDPLVLNDNPSDVTPFGVPSSLYPSLYSSYVGDQYNQYKGTLTTVTDISLNVPFGCSGSFTSSCTQGPAYDFEWNYGTGSMIGLRNFSLQPGESHDYLFGTFKPTNGVAPVGTYEFYAAYLSIYFRGTISGIKTDQFGNPIPLQDPVLDPVYQQERDIDGNLVFDESGNPVYLQQVDGDGNFVYDEFGNPVFVQELDGDGNPKFVQRLDVDGNPLYTARLDIDGKPIFETVVVDNAEGQFQIAATPCENQNNQVCAGAFVRTVSAVPVPGAVWFFGSALLGYLGVSKRHRYF